MMKAPLSFPTGKRHVSLTEFVSVFVLVSPFLTATTSGQLRLSHNARQQLLYSVNGVEIQTNDTNQAEKAVPVRVAADRNDRQGQRARGLSNISLNEYILITQENVNSQSYGQSTVNPETTIATATSTPAFLHASGTRIVDGKGQNMILRGMGFGGWLLQESYMMLVGDSAKQGQHSVFAEVEDLIGSTNLQTYHKAWLDNYCSLQDVLELKKAGFNSLRVPMHYNLFTLPIEQEPVRGTDTWLQDGFDRLDLLLQWCKTAQVYLILDLHAAPGGQGRDAGISDYDPTKPSLWEDDENIRKTIALWQKFASRYKDETWIGAYDLLNEPNWNFSPGHPNGCSETTNTPLKDFYNALIPAIRSIDNNHLLVIEGNCWSNNHKGLWPIQDDNVAISFHRYWIPNTPDTIQEFLDLRDTYQVPLWMGESGENTNTWYSDAVQLLESNNIGWAWWTWKKMQYDPSNNQGAYRIDPPDGYYALKDYWSNGGTKPDPSVAFEVMMDVANQAKLSNNVRNNEAIASLTGNIRSCDTAEPIQVQPTAATRIEIEEYCSMFGLRIETTQDSGGGQDAGWIDANDWVSFKIEVVTAQTYFVSYRISSPEGEGSLALELSNSSGENATLGTIAAFPATGDWQSWITVNHAVAIPAGEYILTVRAIDPGWNINWLETGLQGSPPNPVGTPTPLSHSPTPRPSHSPTPRPIHSPTLRPSPSPALRPNPNPIVAYVSVPTPLPSRTSEETSGPGTVPSIPYGIPKCATNETVSIPGIVQGEYFCESWGISVETTKDVGGGLDIGWIDAGDWLAYNVQVAYAGRYEASYRIASANGDGGLQLEWFGGLGPIGDTITGFPSTYDWQTWTTVSNQVVLPKGDYTIAVRATEGGWNLNSFRVALVQEY